MLAVTTAAEMLTYAAERENAWVFLARMATLQDFRLSTAMRSGNSTPMPKSIIGESGG